jgi:RNA polymerase sigma-70 factor, ECF subfamily
MKPLRDHHDLSLPEGVRLGGSAAHADEHRLVLGLQGRTEQGRGEFFVRAHDAVYALACRLTPDHDLRRDWTHDSLLRLAEEVADGRFAYRGPGSFWGWFRVRVPYLLLDQMRARRRLEARELAAEAMPEGPPDPAAADDPVQDLQRDEILLAVTACLESLANVDQRRALELLLFREATYEEIAAALGRPLNTVRTDIRRGRLALRQCLIRRLELDHDQDQ